MDIVEKTRQALLTLFPDQDESVTSELEETDGEEVKEATPRLPGVLVLDYEAHGAHLDVLCAADQVVAVARILDQEQFFPESIAGVDWPKEERLEVLYDFNRLDGKQCRVLVRVSLPRAEPAVPSISDIFSGADWHERETFDFYGIIFQGHPNLIRILLPEDADFHPLLKDYMP